jgi:two-component system sensor histidine kinase BaeS
VRTLARRLGLLAVAVAVVSTLITSALLIGLAREATVDAARTLLGRDVEVLASVARGSAAARSTGLGVDVVRQALERREITSVVVDPADPAAVAEVGDPFMPQDVTVAASGADVSRTGAAGGRRWLVEGRQAGDVVVLAAQPVDVATSVVPPPRRRVVLAAVLGAAAGAVGGILLARAIARPVVRLDAAARRLTAGERGIRVEPEGPREIADLAVALNALSDALATSEERQRRFLLTVSHELRTPLTAVTGYGEALADGVVTGDAVRDAGRVIVEESGRLRRRVDELLALARLEADDVTLELTETDVAGLVAAAHQAWRVPARRLQVPLLLDVPIGMPLVARADPERLRQAVDALTDNAVRVVATLPVTGGSRPPVVLAARSDPAAGIVVVEVRDGGPGLEPDEMSMAFEPGLLRERYRGSRPVGSGVGLALVGRLAGLMGGTASADRAPEGGLRVAIRLLSVHRSSGVDPQVPV